jgi:RNA polymerase sigma-70 factor (ECF subfamily)
MKLFEIYYAFQDDFIRYAKSLTHAHESAEDLVQNAYLKALEQLDTFESLHPAQIKGWFFSTIHHRFIDDLRKNKRLEYVETFPDIGRSFESQWHFKTSLVNILNTFPEEQRTLIVMRYLHGLNSKEISERTGLNASTVRSRLSLITPLLKKHIQEELL